MADLRTKLIPQYSLRRLLAVMAALAVVSFIMSLALREQAWAAGALIGLVSLAVIFAFYAAVFAVAWLISVGLRRRNRRPPTTEPPPSPVPSPPVIVVWIAVFAIGALAACGSHAHAASGGTITLPAAPAAMGPVPTAPPPPKSGLTLTIDTTWVDSFGYRPVRITFTSTKGPLSADRVLTVRCKAKNGYLTRDSSIVTQSIEMLAGSTTASATLAVPQLAPMVTWEIETYEDGQQIEELSVRTGWTSWGGTFQGDGSSPVTLILSNASSVTIPSVQASGATPETLSIGGQPLTMGGFSRRVALAGPATPSAGTAPSIPTLADLPTRWICYSGVDMIILSLSDLQTLIDKHPAQWSAIHDWLNNGGTLVVFGIGRRWQNIASLEKRLAIESKASPEGDDALDPSKRGWLLPRKSLRDLEYAAVINAEQDAPNDSSETPEGEQPSGTGSLPNDIVDARSAPFALHPFGLGMIVALPTSETASSINPNWKWLFNSLGTQRWQWFQRYGLSVYRANEDFWNFLIPGVGLAPVVQFQVLITAFVLAIGPLNYILLKRRGKLNLLVITVPLSALVVTGGLILFALISDGLSVRLRDRSVTRIDQQSGEATCWARLSFYAGLAPSNGLTFADDTVVLPLDFSPVTDESAIPRELEWKNTERGNFQSPLMQNLTDGWLRSRTPTQFVTARVRKTSAKLDIKPADGNGLKVTNGLGIVVQNLIVADDAGQCYFADEIGIRSQVTAAQIGSNDAAFKKMTAILDTYEPRRPEAMSPSGGRGYFGQSGQQTYGPNTYGGAWVARSGNDAAPTQQTGVLEQLMSSVRRQLRTGKLPPRTYIAVVEKSPEFQSGTESAREEASLHVVVGTW